MMPPTYSTLYSGIPGPRFVVSHSPTPPLNADAIVAGNARIDEAKMTGMTPPVFTFSGMRSEEHTSELQSRFDLVCRLLLEKKNSRLVLCLSFLCQKRSHSVR